MASSSKCFRQPSEILLGIYNIRDGILSFRWVRGTQWVKGWIIQIGIRPLSHVEINWIHLGYLPVRLADIRDIQATDVGIVT